MPYVPRDANSAIEVDPSYTKVTTQLPLFLILCNDDLGLINLHQGILS